MLAVEGLRGESHARGAQVCSEEQVGAARSETKRFQEVGMACCAGEAKVDKEKMKMIHHQGRGGREILAYYMVFVNYI